MFRSHNNSEENKGVAKTSRPRAAACLERFGVLLVSGARRSLRMFESHHVKLARPRFDTVPSPLTL